MRVFFKVGGTIVSALLTIAFNVLGIRETATLLGYAFDWKLFTLVSFIFFLIFVAWWIGGLESYKRHVQNAKPNLVFTEPRETPLFENGKPLYHGLQAWFVNRPKTATKDSVAENVTARIHFYDKSTKGKLSVYGLWVLGQAYDFAGYSGAVNEIDRIPPNDEPRKLAIAIKWQEDDSAYAFVEESRLFSQKQDYREKIREIKKGTHYVKVEIHGVGIGQEPYWFSLDNPGAGKELSLSAPIKKPNLHKEGFQTE